MKFQNPSLKFYLNRRTNKWTNERTSRKQYAPHFFRVGGIKRGLFQRYMCTMLYIGSATEFQYEKASNVIPHSSFKVQYLSATSCHISSKESR